MADTHDVVIVGAGVAGLTAARSLIRAGHDVLVLEREESPGGRIRTDVIDGFRLDHGFQLLNPAYPAAKRNLDLSALRLQPFPKGVRLGESGEVLSLSPGTYRSWWRLAAGKVGNRRGLAAFARYAVTCGIVEPGRLRRRPDLRLDTALREHGVDVQTLRTLVFPFLTGVFGQDDPGAVSRRYGDFVLRTFVRGRPALPTAGMQAIPEQLAAGVSGAIRYGARVTGVSSGAVQVADGEVRCRVVIVATDALTAGRLVADFEPPTMNDLTTWYFTTSTQVNVRELVVAPVQAMLANVAVVSNSAASYAPNGRRLIAASAVGLLKDDSQAHRARTEAARFLGIPSDSLAELARYPIAHALPQLGPGRGLRRPLDFDGVIVVGDHQDTPSIQGALVSGERGAAAAEKALG